VDSRSGETMRAVQAADLASGNDAEELAFSREFEAVRILRARADEFESIGEVARGLLAGQQRVLLARLDEDLIVFVRPETNTLRVNVGLGVFVDMALTVAVAYCAATSARLSAEANAMERLWATRYAVHRTLKIQREWEATRAQFSR